MSDEPKGDCFHAAFSHLMEVAATDHDGKVFKLVHGNVTDLPQDTEVNHAWVEEGDTVHEVSNGQDLRFPKHEYYGRHWVTKIRTYTLMEALAKHAQHDHYGAWD